MIQRYSRGMVCLNLEGKDTEGDFVKYEDHLAVVEQLEYELRYLREEETRLHDYIANLEYYVAEHVLMNEKEPIY